MKTLSRIWNTFLDTTPRQWVHYFSEYFQTPRISFERGGTYSLLFSAFTHVLAFYMIFFYIEPVPKSEPSKEIYEVALLEMARSGTKDVEPVYDENSDIYLPAEKKKKKKPLTLAQRLLQKYRHSELPSLNSKEKNEGEQKPKWRSAARKENSKVREMVRKDLISQLSLDQLNSKEDKKDFGSLKDELNQHLALYQKSLQSCYEASLLKDESLNGKVSFELRTGKEGEVVKGDVSFNGVGRPETRESLENCLMRVVRQIRFPAQMTAAMSRTIQFQAVLSL